MLDLNFFIYHLNIIYLHINNISNLLYKKILKFIEFHFGY